MVSMTELTPDEFEKAVEKISAALQATPKRSRRVLLKTLLKEFGFKVRSGDRVTRMAAGLNDAGIHVFPNLADCDRDDWVTLSLLDAQVPSGEDNPVPKIDKLIAEDPWFDTIREKSFASEREVEIRFIVPLLERLGYHEDDRADGYPVDIVTGVKKTRAEADFVLFDGSKREVGNVLLVVEAKRTGKRLSDHIAQAHSYALYLAAPYYMLTNGDDIRVFVNQAPIGKDVEIFKGNRQDLRGSFSELYQLISRDVVVEYRRAWMSRHGIV